jgi:lysozyme
MNVYALRQQLIRHEGCVLLPYTDTTGHITIGIGRNLTDRGISEATALQMLEEDIRSHVSELSAALPWFERLDDVRQLVLADMAVNMGVPKLLTFRETLAAVESGDYVQAGEHMLDSLWARQVKVRAQTLAWMMKTGEEPVFA